MISNPDKIGIGQWLNGAGAEELALMADLGLGWYYNWTPWPIDPEDPGRASVPFVPMIWDRNTAGVALPSGVDALLGFNEPDNDAQADMSVEEAIGLWPALAARGLRLGSPAPTTEQALGADTWLGRFMDQARSRDLRVDFVALHYYPKSASLADFEAFLRQAHADYGKPIWVTEWALVDWNDRSKFGLADNAAFAAESLKLLDRLPFVERHAWFSLLRDDEGIETHMFEDGSWTEVGTVYRRLVAGQSDGPRTS